MNNDGRPGEQPLGALAMRVYDDLRARMTDGRLPEGTRLPTERTLAEQLGVSRVTVRRAIAQLRDDRLVQSVQGSGNFVATTVLGETPNALMSFSRLAQARGLVAGTQPIHVIERAASIEEAEQLAIAPGTAIVELDRIRTLDGIPVAISRSLVPRTCLADPTEIDWSTASLYDELASTGHAPVRADYSVEAQAADAVAAGLLQMQAGQPVLVTRSTSFSSGGRVVELALLTYRGDRYRFRSTLHI